MRKEHIWVFGSFKITHVDYTDAFIVHIDNKWKTYYRSLRGAKQYVAKKLGINYSELKFKIHSKNV